MVNKRVTSGNRSASIAEGDCVYFATIIYIILSRLLYFFTHILYLHFTIPIPIYIHFLHLLYTLYESINLSRQNELLDQDLNIFWKQFCKFAI